MVNIRKRIIVVMGAFSMGVVSLGAQAVLITNGFTFSVADDFAGPSFQGTHFHSSTEGDFGNPIGKRFRLEL